MKLELEIFSYLCSTKHFRINGVWASSDEFGNSFDDNPENAEKYGCGYRVFKGFPPRKEVLKKYNISEKEYSEIIDKLESGLSFGNCGWCV